MEPDPQDEFSRLLEAALNLDAVRELEPDRRLRRIHYDWLAAGEATQTTVRRLSEQLRRYLDDRARLENRRITDLIREIRQGALAVRERPPEGDGSSNSMNLLPISTCRWNGRCTRRRCGRKAAMAAGLMGVLVQTGKYRPGQETRLAKPPTLVAKDLRVAVDRLLGSGASALVSNRSG